MNETSATETANGKGAAESGRDWSSPGRFAVLLAVMIFAAFWDVLLGLDTFVVRDFGLFSYPVACFQRQCFWRGKLPFWNPLSCCGLPFLAQFNTLALYPLSFIYLLLPLSWSLPFFCLLHLFIGGMGMYFLAARWTGSRAGAALAGVVFAFNGLTLNFMMWPSHIATFAWIPWVILLTESGWKEGGRKLVLASLAAAMQILGGGPESILFTWLFLLALALIECVKGEMAVFVLARRFILMGLIAAGLAAAQLLPFVDFVLHCQSRHQIRGFGVVHAAVGLGKFPGAKVRDVDVAGHVASTESILDFLVLRRDRHRFFGADGVAAARSLAGLAAGRISGRQPGPGAGGQWRSSMRCCGNCSHFWACSVSRSNSSS